MQRACADYLICQSSSEFRRNDSGTPKTCQNSSNGVCQLICSRPFQTFFFSPAPLFHFHLCLLGFPLRSGSILACPAAFRSLSFLCLQDEGAAVGASGVAPSGRTVVRRGEPLVMGSVCSRDLVRTCELSGPGRSERPSKSWRRQTHVTSVSVCVLCHY